MRKKLLSLALALVMCLSLMPSAFAAGEPGSTAVGGFTDVRAGDYFAEPVLWAVEKKITAGTSKTTFSPGATCNRAQILSFLWRASGSPEPTISNPFMDIKSTDYFYKAALWAAEKGMVSGSTFGANTPCTRAATVEYIWKAAGSPAASYDGKFDDVPASADYAQAVAWALESGVTSGTSKTTFGPDSTCTRGQIVTFLYRGLAKAVGWGTAPTTEQTPPVQSLTELEQKVKSIHDMLWSTGVITSTSTEKEKAIAYYDWMCQNCNYGYPVNYGFSEGTGHNAYDALIYGYAVCDGLSKAYEELLNTENIECVWVPDYAGNHAWNEAVLDGEKYTIDMANSVGCCKNADGSYNERFGERWRNKYFFPDVWESELGVPMD